MIGVTRGWRTEKYSTDRRDVRPRMSDRYRTAVTPSTHLRTVQEAPTRTSAPRWRYVASPSVWRAACSPRSRPESSPKAHTRAITRAALGFAHRPVGRGATTRTASRRTIPPRARIPRSDRPRGTSRTTRPRPRRMPPRPPPTTTPRSHRRRHPTSTRRTRRSPFVPFFVRKAGETDSNAAAPSKQRGAAARRKPTTAPPDESQNLYVKNLPPDFSAAKLANLFLQHGDVLSTKFVAAEPTAGRPAPTGLVRFATRAEAEAAMAQLNGVKLGGDGVGPATEPLEVSVAMSKEQREAQYAERKAAREERMEKRKAWLAKQAEWAQKMKERDARRAAFANRVSIHVRDAPRGLDAESTAKIFKPFGDVARVKLWFANGASPTAVLSMGSAEEAAAAIAMLSGRKLEGCAKPMTITVHKPGNKGDKDGEKAKDESESESESAARRLLPVPSSRSSTSTTRCSPSRRRRWTRRRRSRRRSARRDPNERNEGLSVRRRRPGREGLCSRGNANHPRARARTAASAAARGPPRSAARRSRVPASPSPTRARWNAWNPRRRACDKEAPGGRSARGSTTHSRGSPRVGRRRRP